MNILMTLESSFPPDRRVENEIGSLLEEGHSLDIICTGEKGAPKVDYYKSATIYRIFPPVIIQKSSVAALKLPIYFSYWEKKLRKLMGRKAYDVVHVHDLPLIKPVIKLRKTLGFRIVLDLHENWPGLLDISPHTKTLAGKLLCSIPSWVKYEKRYTPLADKIIVVVEEARDRLLGLNIPVGKIYIVSNTINLNDYDARDNRTERSAAEKILIYEGGITYHRGIQYVLLALAGMKKSPGLLFRVIGKGSYLDRLKKQSKELGIEHMVEFMGWQAQEKVYEMINKADIAVIPHIKSSHTDSTVPHKLFHYMYAGLPVLASNCRPIERILKETSAGYIYQYDDINGLADMIKKLISGNGVRKTTDARQWVIKKYNWLREEKELLRLYRSL